MRIFLDTNASSAMRRGHQRTVALVRRSTEVLLSCFVVGELFYGFRGGDRLERNRDELEAFLNSPRVAFVPATLVTAQRFGLIASQLRRKGQPIPTNDIWIAAHVMETGAELISFDRHFAAVEGLAWTDPEPVGG